MKYLTESFLLDILKQYYNNIISLNSKITDSCLFVNGVNTDSKEPIRWNMEDGTKPIISSITRQIHLLRSFKMFSKITGDNSFYDRYKEIIKLYFKEYQNKSGLFNWGGHIFINIETMKPAGPINKEMQHEIKDTFPDYDSLFEINPESTLKFIKSFWGYHLKDKETFIISRHSSLNENSEFDFSALNSNTESPIFSSYLTFLNSADDLIYSALKYYKYVKDVNAVKAAEILYNKYVSLRDKITGLGTYQYSIPVKRENTGDDNNTMSWFGDRAQRQMGLELGEKALEMNLILERQANTIYAETPVMLFNMYRELGGIVKPLCDMAVKALESFSKYIYIKDTNKCRPLLIDGTDLSGFELKRDGYFGKKGLKFRRYPLNGKIFAAFMMGAALFDNRGLFNTAKSMFSNFGLGNLRDSVFSKPYPNYNTKCSDSQILIALTDLYLLTKVDEYFILAECVTDKLIRNYWYQPYFKPSIASSYAFFDSLEVYAITYFLSVQKGIMPEPFFSSNSTIYGNYLMQNGEIFNIVDKKFFNSIY